MPARSSASQEVSSSSRCCGSIASRLTRRDPEEAGVELGRVVQESALADVTGADAVRVGVVQRLDVPAAVGRQVRNGVDAVGDDPPQVLRAAHSAGHVTGGGHDGDGLVRRVSRSVSL